MTDIKRDVIRKSIQKKGFRLKQGRKDKKKEKYFLYFNNKWYTHIYVKISRGNSYKTYSQSLWKRMKDILQLDTLDEVKQFLECPMSYEQYLDKLRRKNQVR